MVAASCFNPVFLKILKTKLHLLKHQKSKMIMAMLKACFNQVYNLAPIKAKIGLKVKI
jgi:hypothetical protein